MKNEMKKVIALGVILVLGLICISMIFDDDGDPRPLDPDNITSILFQVYTEEGPHYQVEDRELIQAVVSQINAMELKESKKGPDMSSDHYFLLELHGTEGNLTLELDETHIRLGLQEYEADCAPLCALLKNAEDQFL